MKNNKFRLCGTFLFIIVLVTAHIAYAQDGPVPEEDLKSARAEDMKDGWHVKFLPAATFTLNDNRGVSDQPDGYTLTFGLNLQFDVILLRKAHEWRNSLTLSESLTRSPVFDKFYLSNDKLRLESIYLYYIVDWFGMYGRFIFDASIFESWDLQADKSIYAVTKLDGNIDYYEGSQKKLTGYFSPLKLRESLGPFFRPLKREDINIEILLGLGFRQTFIDGNLAITEDDATDWVDLTEQENIYTIGGEDINRIWGERYKKKINYQVFVELYYPFYKSPDPPGLSAADALVIEAGTRWAFRIVDWMSLDYEFKAIRDLQVVDRWQLTNLILFNLSWSIEKFYPDTPRTATDAMEKTPETTQETVE